MLDLPISFLSRTGIVNKVIPASLLTSFTLAPGSTFAYTEHFFSPGENRLLSILDQFEEELSIQEAVSLLFELRDSLINQGYDLPSLEDLCLRMHNYLLNQDVVIDDQEVEEIYEEILRQEDSTTPLIKAAVNTNTSHTFTLVKSHKNKEEKKKEKLKAR